MEILRVLFLGLLFISSVALCAQTDVDNSGLEIKNLFVGAEAPEDGWVPPFEPWVLRHRFVRMGMDIQTLRDVAVASDPRIRLHLFDDAVFTAAIDRHGRNRNGSYSLSGSLAGEPFGTFSLVVNGVIVVGTVRVFNGIYTIRTVDADGTYIIFEVDTSGLPPEAPPIEKGIPIYRRTPAP